MLSGKVLKELVERSHIQDDLIELAWSALDVESKLQIISELQKGGELQLSDKMLALAGKDDSPIVRFWASRFSVVADFLSDVERKAERSDDKIGWLSEHTKEAIKTAKRLQNDEVTIVREMANLKVGLFRGPEEPLNPRQRLLAARFFGTTSIFQMMEWVDKLWQDGDIQQDEVDMIVTEILQSTRVGEEFPADELNRDGMTHFSNLQNAAEIWKMACRLPKYAAKVIGYFAPITVEGSNVLVDVFDELPSETQAAAISRRDSNIAELLERVRANSDNYDEEVLKTVERDDRYAFEMPTDEEIEDNRKRNSVDREQTLIEITLALSKQLEELREELDSVINSKRGGFWRR